MQRPTYTLREDINLLPWQIEAGDMLQQPCILIATMNGNEMLSISLHVAQQPPIPGSAVSARDQNS
jgi:hypothetical protein